MKENFEPALRAVRDVARESPTKKKPAVLQEIGASMKRTEKKEYVTGLEEMIPVASRLKVFEVQKEKQRVVRWLHEQLRMIDNEESVESFNHRNEPYEVDKDLETAFPDGRMGKVTVGEIVTDGDWGTEYRLSSDVNRDIKKKFVVAEAKREIARLLNQQIGITESQREIPKWMDGGLKRHMEHIKNTYQTVLDRGQEGVQSGLISEKMVKTYFEKFQIDNRPLFAFEGADSSDDIERKIDFFIHKRTHAHTRGVGTEESKNNEDVGIQFTIDPNATEKKLAQIKRSKKEFGMKDVDDIVLVTIPLQQSKDIYDRWEQAGRPPGGPEKLWKEATQERIFRGVLNGFFKKKEIDDMWNGDIVSDEEKIEELKRKIENGIGNPNGRVSLENGPEPKMSAQELSQRAEELLRKNQKTRISDEGGKENLDKFKKRFGERSFISTRKLK
jgi:hypothetical protein